MSYSCPHCQKAIDDAIPKARFDEVYEERKTLKAQVSDLEKSGKSADKIAAKLEASEKALQDLTAKHEVDLVMLDLGIKDADVRDALEWQYGKLPAEGRAPFTDTVKAWHEKPEEAPAVVRSLLPKGAAPTSTPAQLPTNGGALPRPGFGGIPTGSKVPGPRKPSSPVAFGRSSRPARSLRPMSTRPVRH